MMEEMTILEATSQTSHLDVRRRSQYNFQSLAAVIPRSENDETFVNRSILEKTGFLVEPFWDEVGDLEGDAYRGYIEEHPSFDLCVRQGVYECLIRAQQHLPETWQLVLKAGFRPLDVQWQLIDIFTSKSRHEHPDWTDEQHLEHARTFVSDPRLVCPPHATGGAVDVAAKDRTTGKLIDMGCPPNTDDETAFLYSDALSATQRKHRMALLQAMMAAGFAPNPYEWWHYQYGETYWAAFYGHESTLYDLTTV